MGQAFLFDTSEPGRNQYGYPIEPRDPHVHPEEAPRLSRQCRAILSRLKEGPATNAELAKIALKYSGRTSDLRAAGCIIDVIERDHKSGYVLYRLTYCPEGL